MEQNKSLEERMSELELRVDEFGKAVKRRFLGIYISANLKCKMCSLELDFLCCEKKLTTEELNALCLHTIFKSVHPEESCENFRETERIKALLLEEHKKEMNMNKKLEDKLVEERVTALELSLHKLRTAVKRGFAARDISANEKCDMCTLEIDFLCGEKELPTEPTEEIYALSLHKMFKTYHPEEPCNQFRETEKIKSLHKCAADQIHSLLDM
jgi:hypothetical protein